MHNAFLQYEQDFRQWVDAGFPEINPLSRDFLEYLKRDDAPRKLWRHQQESVYRAVYAYELLHIKGLLLNIVTGGGKSAGEAPTDSLKRALWHCRNDLPKNIKDKPGLVASMVKYKKAGTNAGK
jgi:hypothetical protein